MCSYAQREYFLKYFEQTQKGVHVTHGTRGKDFYASAKAREAMRRWMHGATIREIWMDTDISSSTQNHIRSFWRERIEERLAGEARREQESTIQRLEPLRAEERTLENFINLGLAIVLMALLDYGDAVAGREHRLRGIRCQSKSAKGRAKFLRESRDMEKAYCLFFFRKSPILGAFGVDGERIQRIIETAVAQGRWENLRKRINREYWSVATRQNKEDGQNANVQIIADFGRMRDVWA